MCFQENLFARLSRRVDDDHDYDHDDHGEGDENDDHGEDDDDNHLQVCFHESFFVPLSRLRRFGETRVGSAKSQTLNF